MIIETAYNIDEVAGPEWLEWYFQEKVGDYSRFKERLEKGERVIIRRDALPEAEVITTLRIDLPKQ